MNILSAEELIRGQLNPATGSDQQAQIQGIAAQNQAQQMRVQSQVMANVQQQQVMQMQSTVSFWISYFFQDIFLVLNSNYSDSFRRYTY